MKPENCKELLEFSFEYYEANLGLRWSLDQRYRYYARFAYTGIPPDHQSLDWWYASYQSLGVLYQVKDFPESFLMPDFTSTKA